MGWAAFGLVALISLSHAMVHLYEMLWPGVELHAATQWNLSDLTVGRLMNAFALPFGVLALPAGWLADRFGAKRTLIAYLVGASGSCLAIGYSGGVGSLTAGLVALGVACSIYHPAGLGTISRIVPKRDVGMALAWHGIIGTLGIGGGPLLAGVLLGSLHWHEIYLAVVPLGLTLAAYFAMALPGRRDGASAERPRNVPADDTHWDPVGFGLLCVTLVFFGVLFRGFVTFLPRLVDGSTLAGMVLLVGVVGQYLGGWLSGRFRLETLLAVGLLVNGALILAAGHDVGGHRVILLTLFVVAHLALQPVTNGLVASYTPGARRSLAYGLTFTLSFGVGSFGASYAGWVAQRQGVDAVCDHLAGIACVGAAVATAGWWRLRGAPSQDSS